MDKKYKKLVKELKRSRKDEMKMESKITKNEMNVLDHFLYGYLDMTFGDILYNIEEGMGGMIFREPFERYSDKKMVKEMEKMLSNLNEEK